MKSISCLGESFAVFRSSNSGEVFVLDAFCPHMGADLGVGGIVRNDCIECPFHQWTFSGVDGKCVEIPYSNGLTESKATLIETWTYFSQRHSFSWKVCETEEVDLLGAKRIDFRLVSHGERRAVGPAGCWQHWHRTLEVSRSQWVCCKVSHPRHSWKRCWRGWVCSLRDVFDSVRWFDLDCQKIITIYWHIETSAVKLFQRIQIVSLKLIWCRFTDRAWRRARTFALRDPGGFQLDTTFGMQSKIEIQAGDCILIHELLYSDGASMNVTDTRQR